MNVREEIIVELCSRSDHLMMELAGSEVALREMKRTTIS
jgi:hypothetical protein